MSSTTTSIESKIDQELKAYRAANAGCLEDSFKEAVQNFGAATTSEQRFRSFTGAQIAKLYWENRALTLALMQVMYSPDISAEDKANHFRTILNALQNDLVASFSTVKKIPVSEIIGILDCFREQAWLKTAIVSSDVTNPSPVVSLGKQLMTELNTYAVLMARRQYLATMMNTYGVYLGFTVPLIDMTPVRLSERNAALNVSEVLARHLPEYAIAKAADHILGLKTQADTAEGLATKGNGSLKTLGGQTLSAMNPKLIAMANNDFVNVVEPAFKEKFLSFSTTKDEKECVEKIVLLMRETILEAIETQARSDIAANQNVSKNQAILSFIQTNKAPLIAGQEKVLAQALNCFSSNELAAHCAWRSLDPNAPIRNPYMWPNLLVGDPEIRIRACYYYLTAIDDSTPEARDNRPTRINDFIFYMAAVRRAQNITKTGMGIDDGGVDEHPCPPGHVTRLSNIPKKHPHLKLSTDLRGFIEQVAKDYISKIFRISLLKLRLEAAIFGQPQYRSFQQQANQTLDQVMVSYSEARELDRSIQSSLDDITRRMATIQPEIDADTQQKAESLFMALVGLSSYNAAEVATKPHEYKVEWWNLRLRFQAQMNNSAMKRAVAERPIKAGSWTPQYLPLGLLNFPGPELSYFQYAVADLGGRHLITTLRHEFQPYSAHIIWEEDDAVAVDNPFQSVRVFAPANVSEIVKGNCKNKEKKNWQSYYFYEFNLPVFKAYLSGLSAHCLRNLMEQFVEEVCSNLAHPNLKQHLRDTLEGIAKKMGDVSGENNESTAIFTVLQSLTPSIKDTLFDDLACAYNKVPAFKTHEEEVALGVQNSRVKDKDALPGYVLRKIMAPSEIERSVAANGGTALMRVAHEGRLNAVMLLLTAGANLKAEDTYKHNALWYAQQVSPDAALNAKRQEGLQALRFMQNPLMSTPLIWAAIHNRVDILIEVLGYIAATTPDLEQRKKRIDAPNSQGATALLWGAYQGSFESVMVLIEAGGNPSHRNSAGTDAYALAKTGGHVDLSAALEAMKDPLRGTPLIWSAIKNRTDVLALLINLIAATTPDLEQRKRRINAPNPQNATALLWATYHNNFESVMLLIGAGGNPDHRNVAGADAYALASPTSHGALSTALNELRTHNSTPLVWSQAHQADRPTLNPLLKQEGQDLARSNPYKK